MQRQERFSGRTVASPTPTLPRQNTGAQQFLLSFWWIVLFFSPLYLFKSGLPQIADGLMAVLIALLFTGYFTRVVVNNSLYMAAFAFLGLVAIVNWVWWIHYPDTKFFLSSIYYLYNFCIVMTVITLMARFGDRFISWTRTALLASLLVELTAILLLGEFRGVRAIGTFNNPNQLGYWGLLVAACLLSLKPDPGAARSGARLAGIDLLAILGLGVVAAQSLSKAAMVSFIVLVLAAVYYQGMSARLKLVSALLLVVGAGAVISGISSTPSGGSKSLVDRVTARFEDIGKQGDDSAEQRGYDRIWLYPEYLLYGAGEGAEERFDASAAGDIEMHSTFGTLLFSYGILGFTLFLGFLWIIFRRAHYRHVIYFVPVCLYGLTHQGLRFSLLWVFLGIVFGQGYVRRTSPVRPRKIQNPPLSLNGR